MKASEVDMKLQVQLAKEHADKLREIAEHKGQSFSVWVRKSIERDFRKVKLEQAND